MLSEGHGVSVFLRDSAGTVHELAVTEASCYEIRAAVPALAAEGVCTLYVMNESSGAIAELETEVHPAGYFECAKKKDKLFNVVEYGAVGIIQRSFDYARDITYENLPDSAPGFQRALMLRARTAAVRYLYRTDATTSTDLSLSRAAFALRARIRTAYGSSFRSAWDR